MPPRSAIPSRRAHDLAFLASAEELPIVAGTHLPDWIKIAPAGNLTCRDGRVYSLDPPALVERFKAERVDIPIDLGHGTAKGADAPALGWVDALEARPDGLWGHVKEWLSGGRSILEARTHRYISPAFHHDADGRATWLHSIALVAAPALAMPALLAARPRTDEIGMLDALVTTLGLDEGASRATCLAAIAELKAGAVPKAAHETTLATLAAAQGELATLRAAIRREKVEGVVEGALKALKIVPAEREHYIALCATDAGFATVRTLLAQAPARMAPSALDRRGLDVAAHAGASSPEALAAAAKTLMVERATKGMREISLADAMSIVVRDLAL